MRRIVLLLVMSVLLALPVSAADISAPTVPESAKSYMPSSQDHFGLGILEVIRDALMHFQPDFRDALRVCMVMFAVVVCISLMRSLPGSAHKAVDLAGTVAVAALLFEGTLSLIRVGAQTVTDVSEYGKLLFPVMATAMAAQGAVSSSAALYTGTVVFNTLLSSVISNILTPLIYLYLAVSTAAGASGAEMLKKIQDLLKWAATWILKTILYVFTGYMGITGVVSGTTDAATLKAAKLTISGMVPVVGGILSDASEAVLIGAGTVKNAAGIYGLFAVIAICIGPFLKIGVRYLLLKVTGGLCSVFGSKQTTELIGNFSTGMGLLLGMTGSECLMLMISTVCFMKGVG